MSNILAPRGLATLLTLRATRPGKTLTQLPVRAQPKPFGGPGNEGEAEFIDRLTSRLAFTSAEEAPFTIRRSSRGNLPVYARVRNGRTRWQTHITGVTGNTDLLAAELRKVVGRSAEIKAKQAKLVIKGDAVARVSAYLSKLGF